MRWLVASTISVVSLFGAAVPRSAVSATAPSKVAPKFVFGGLPVVDAGAIAEIVFNGILLGGISGSAAATLATINDIWGDAQAQAKPVGGWSWGRIVADLPNLGAIAQQGSALAWSLPGLAGTFGGRYPGWSVPGKGWFGQVQSWVMTALNTAQGLAGVASTRYGQMISDLPDFGSLQGFVAAATGRDAALEAGNQVNLWTAEQVEQMNATVAAEAANEAAYFGYQVQKDAAEEATAQAFFTFVPYAGGGDSYDCCSK